MDLRGTGQLAGVRAIYSSGHALVWLEVDSANDRSGQAAGWSNSGGAAEGLPAAGTPPSGDATVGATAGATGGATPGAVGGAAARPGPAPLPSMPAPSWVASGFDAAAFQQKAAALAAALAAPGAGASGTEPRQAQHAAAQQQQQLAGSQAGSMAQKAEEWCVHHHTSLAERGEAPSAAARP